MGLNDKIKESIKEVMAEEQEEKLKSKKWRLPRKAKVGKKKAQKNWIGILKLNENGSIEPTKQQILEQTVMVDGIPRISTPEFVLRWVHGRKTFPVLLLPSWSVKPLKPEDLEGKPFNPQESKEKSFQDGSNIVGYQLLMNRMQMSKVDLKGKGGMGWLKWVAGAAALALLGYALWSGALW